MSQALLYSGSDSAERVLVAQRAVLEALGEVSVTVIAPRAEWSTRAVEPATVVSLADLARLDYAHLVLDDPGGGDDPFVSQLLNDALSRPLQGIHRWSKDVGLEVYAPYDNARARVLNVFPGMPFPVRMGSQRRVCELTRHLNRTGVHVDLLVRQSADAQAPEVLRALTPRARAYQPLRVGLSPRRRLRRAAEKLVRKTKGMKSRPPELFSERMSVQASEADVTALREALETGQYDTVILNYAWLSGVMRGLPGELRQRIRWLCDTHDVQFVRNATANDGEWRLGVDFEREKRAEVEALREFDAVIAISESDAAHLSEVVEPSKVVLAPTGFDYACAPRRAQWPLDSTALRFGFLGGPMHANAAAVERLVRDWWPRVLEAWPESTLVIAGAVGQRADVRDLCFLEAGIEVVGFVPSLRGYYESIDVALSPVVVQGGLNFKSVEALMAGVLLVTTSMGMTCLGNDAPAIGVESGEELVSELRRVLRDVGNGERPTERARAWAQARFGSRTSYAPLVERLRHA